MVATGQSCSRLPKRARFTFLLAMALVAATAVIYGTASADSETVLDPQGDAPGFPAFRDLKAVGHAHSASGRLVHTVRVYGRARVTPNRVPLLQIDTAGDSVAEYRVYEGASGGVIERLADGHTDSVSLKRVGRHSLEYSFGPSKIGNPAGYQWDALSLTSRGLADRAPDFSMLSHSLTSTLAR